jgi:hypothetical protein
LRILIYPAGTEIPPNKQGQASVSPETPSVQPIQAATTATPKPQ